MRDWHAVVSRLRDLFRPSRLEREIDDELRFHLDEEVEEGLRRGLTAEQARRMALESLGDTQLRVREEIRDLRRSTALDDLRRDLRHAVRLLQRSPALASVVIGTLAIAIGAAVTAFSITDAWLFRPLPFPAPNRLVVSFMASAASPSEPAVWMPYRAYVSWKASARSFASISGAFFHGATWRTSSGARSLVGMRVTPEFFATLGVAPLRGRTLSAADETGPAAVVIAYGFWQRELGGSADALGRPITLGDSTYTVAGIMPADFDVRLLDRPEGAAFWTLIRTGERGYDAAGMGPITIVGRLADGVAIETARAEVAAILARAESAYRINFNQPDAMGNRFVVTLSSLQADNTRTIRATVLTVLAAALCLLLIAAMNVGVLLLGRGLGRRGEVAVRHALGAGRGRLIRQFLTESLMLSACGTVLGIGLAYAGTRAFLAWNPLGTLPSNAVQIDLRALAAAGVGLAVTTIVAGLAPALRLSVAGPAEALRSADRGRPGAPAHRAQRAMLVVQLAVSTVLLVCAVLLARTFVQLRSEPLGFTAAGVAVAQIELPATPFGSNEARNAFVDRLEAQLLARPGVVAVAASTVPPLSGGAPVTVQRGPLDEATAPRISAQAVTAGYFAALDIPVLAGRAFDRRDTEGGLPVMTLNAKAAADLFGDPRRAVGQRLRLDDDGWREVVGVVGNVRTTFFNTLEWRTDPIVYRPAAQAFSRLPGPDATGFTLWVHVRAVRPPSADDVRDAALAAGPRAAVIELQRVSDAVASATRQPTVRMNLLLWFCGISLLLAAIGVYGLVTQAVTERVHEIAVRLALGASPRLVRAAFVRRVIVAGVAGLTLGVVVALLLARTLASILYVERGGGLVSVTMAATVLLAVIGVAAWVPATRATRVNTVYVLRS
jgi:predicted permease